MLKRIRLTLARSREFPDGSTRFGYELIAPIDNTGVLDVDEWKLKRADCTVRHFAEGKDDETGMLVHKAGGAKRGRWIFDYDFGDESDDEAGYLFGSHVFAPGEYVTVRDAKGRFTTFNVAAVDALASLE